MFAIDKGFWLAVMGIFFVLSAMAQGKEDKIVESNSVSVSTDYLKNVLLRQKAAHRQRRIIQNNDGEDIRTLVMGLDPNVPCTKEDYLKLRCTKDKYLNLRCRGLESTQVDTISYCWSSATNQLDHGNFTEADLNEVAPLWHNEKVQIDSKAAWNLLSESMDIMIAFAHQNGKEIFWSMRMNDNHDSHWQRLFSNWKKNHPECLMGSKGDYFPYGGGAWSAMDYSLSEVRDKIFLITKDICSKYDIDGIELDFFRHPAFFKAQMYGRPVTQVECDIMTDLLRRIRQMTESVGVRRNKPILIMIHIPGSVEYNKATGLDVRQWLKEDLADIVVGGGYFILEPWENLVSLGREYNVPVYACLSSDRVNFINRDSKEAHLHDLYKEAARAWKAGVDGIYTFNYFSPRSVIWNKIGSLSSLEEEGYYDPEYLPIPFGATGFDFFLKGGSNYSYAVKINANVNFFIDSVTIEMQFPDAQYEIFYTLDGTEPNIKSSTYGGPFAIKKSTTVKALAVNKRGIRSWPSQNKFIKADQIIYPSENEFPVKIFGRPVGSEIKLNYEIPVFPQTAQVGLYLTMNNVQAQKEVQIFINGQGPILAPKEIVSYHRSLSAMLSFPLMFLKTGKNQIKVVFADNLNGKTGGFYIEKPPVLLLFY